jgi:uncharacterized protein YdcH (DUF465 family)
VGTVPVSFEELHAEYLVEIDAKVRAEKEVERLTVELTHRVGWEERCMDAEAALATLRAENARLAHYTTAMESQDEEIENLQQAIKQTWRPEVKALRAQNERLRAHVKDAETVLELGKAWWLARGHSRAVAEAAFGEAVGSYDPAAYQP